MRQLWAVYLATRPNPNAERRCCTDVPDGFELASGPTTPGRWARKLRSALPASASAFRGTLRLPNHAARPAVGRRVVSTAGAHVGRVEDVVVGLASGETAYAVVPQDEATDGVILLPTEAFRRTGRNGALVVDGAAVDRAKERVASPAA
jgi:sporulation protein YlmC with PRC-barrel domain